MRGHTPILFVLFLLVAATLVAGQASAQTQSVILHETPGETYTDNLNRFGWAYLNNIGEHVVHQNSEFTITYRDTTLFSTTAASGHDYDGVDRYYIAFPGAGDYQVTVGVPDESGSTASFNGTVDDRPTQNATIAWNPPATATTGERIPFAYQVTTEDDEPIAHAQVRFEVWNLERDTLVFETDTHAHQGLQGAAAASDEDGSKEILGSEVVDTSDADHRVDYTFEESGTHLVRLTAFQASSSKNFLAFPSFTSQQEIEVEAGTPKTPGVPTSTPLENRVDEETTDGPYRIFAGYDPYTSVGVGNPITLSTVVTDPDTQTPVAHLDYTARLTGPDGELLFETDSLHSFDGILEITTSHQTVGDYRLSVHVESMRDDWQGDAEFVYSVLPPAITMTPGPHFVTVDGLEALDAGTPGEIEVSVASLPGEPFAHGEIHIRITDDATGRLLLAGKLHTHDDGTFPFTFTPPAAGGYTLHVDPFPLTPSPPTGHHGAELGDSRLFAFEAGGSHDPFGLAPENDDPPSEVEPTPLALIGPLLLIVTLTIGARRLRSRVHP